MPMPGGARNQEWSILNAMRMSRVARQNLCAHPDANPGLPLKTVAHRS